MKPYFHRDLRDCFTFFGPIANDWGPFFEVILRLTHGLIQGARP